MSIRIKLQYTKALNLELIEKGIEIWARRLTSQVCFKTKSGWTQPYEAIVDTGAPVSIIPPPIIEPQLAGRHSETQYDELLAEGYERSYARAGRPTPPDHNLNA